MATRIIVVDDEPAIGKLITYQLTTCGYQVNYIQDGLLALHRIFAERPDLVLLDVMMPLISGWELCRQIRASSSIPVIMLTAKSADPDIVTGLRAGADDYVTKPFSMVQLQARIEAVLRRVPASPRGAAPAAASPAPPTSARGPQLPAEPRPPQPPAEPPSASLPAGQRFGAYVRTLRQSRGLSLLQIERACQVRWEFVQAIEQENWGYIPHRELRRAMRLYGAYLGVDLYVLARRGTSAPPTYEVTSGQFAAILGVVVLLAAAFSMYLMMSLHYIRL
jgi:CheY-like chemotaxis protein/transcriptional regulator with XRE-family HTH domain